MSNDVVCMFCRKGPMDGVTVHRINEKGVDGIWACNTHRYSGWDDKVTTPASQRGTRKITGRDTWGCRLALIRFMQEASPDQLVQVALYAATVMVNAASLTPNEAME